MKKMLSAVEKTLAPANVILFIILYFTLGIQAVER